MFRRDNWLVAENDTRNAFQRNAWCIIQMQFRPLDTITKRSVGTHLICQHISTNHMCRWHI